MLLFADYETFYGADYTLKKMTPAEYILDPRFRAHGMAFQVGEKGPRKWAEPELLPAMFDNLIKRQAAGEKITMVTYNALFDMCITAWKYGFVPDLMIDVLGMVRATYGQMLRRMSLGVVGEFLNLPIKKGTIINDVRDMSIEDIKARGMWPAYTQYGMDDVGVMVGIYRHIMPGFPLRELGIMDLVLRCAVQPMFRFNKPLLEQHLIDTKQRKADLLTAAGLTYDADGKCPELMSTVKFATLLQEQGVIIETKTTLSGRTAPALAKTDTFMSSLVEHENETVAALAAARLGHKSTLEETRCQRFINIASLPSAPGYVAGSAPMPLRYGAAHTHRLGGDWLLNVQNLPRKSKLRTSITVTDDEDLIAADEAQIEARISAWIAHEKTLLREFAENIDPYGQLGATIFGLRWEKAFKTLHPVERFIGKTGILGLGYGAGKDKFFTMVNTMARGMLPATQIPEGGFPKALTDKGVDTYRTRYHRMPYIWSFLQNDGMAALTGRSVSCVLHPVVIKRGVIWGPNGQRMIYPNLQQDASGEWSYQSGNQRSKIYGAKLLENITQWLARIVVMEAGLRLHHNHGIRFGLQAHDELVFVSKKVNTVQTKALVKLEMERRPTWGPDIPLEVEVGQGANYGEAK